MRCHICNATLSPAEVQWNSDHEDWDPCNKCIQAIDEVFSDLSEEEIYSELELELELFEDEPGEASDFGAEEKA